MESTKERTATVTNEMWASDTAGRGHRLPPGVYPVVAVDYTADGDVRITGPQGQEYEISPTNAGVAFDPALGADERAVLAVALAVRFRHTDGKHHQLWLTDQMIQLLAGDRYPHLVSTFEGEVRRDGLGTYVRDWDAGVAP